MTTLYWHDYETWGEVPAKDRPSQFAGIRTDEDLNIIGQPLMIYCKPTDDFLPKPEACLVTGLTPQQALREGLSEPEFIAAIHAELAQSGTCGVGYNTIRFDDEVSRYTLYRNFFDPYEREWRNGNSRWDIIDMVRLTKALRPDGIEWPLREDGLPSFKLEHLTVANGLSHEAAHDALSDVYATIGVAKLIKERQPQLYKYVFDLRAKRKVAELIDIINRKPLLHISSMFPAENGCAAVVSPLAMHPTNSNGVIVFNLSEDPTPLFDLSVEQIRERIFTRTEDLPEGVSRLPLKVVHLNKCPVLTTVKLLDPASQERLHIDMGQCEKHWQMLKSVDLRQKLQQVFGESTFATPSDPEQQLYNGFLNDADKATCEAVRRASPEQLAQQTFAFHDKRLGEMLFRYRARHFNHTLNADEQQQWQQFRQARLTDPQAEGSLTYEAFRQRLAALGSDASLSADKQEILSALEDYAETLMGSVSAVV
jgi:exodeoxyribonuclease-1